MLRCPPCQELNRKVVQARALRSETGRWHSGRLVAGKRGIAWELTREQFARLSALPCTYCGNPQSGSGAGLDRLDNELGYTVDNVVPSCWPCNYIRRRGDFTYEEMRTLGPVLGPIWRVHPPRGTATRRDRS